MRKVLILTTLSMLETFRREVCRFAPKLKDEVEILRGSGEEKVAQFINSKKTIFITNHDSINTNFGKFLEEQAKDLFLLIVDESHKFKGPTAKRTKRLMKIAQKAKRVLIMTGSPILNDERDLWSQMFLVDPEILGRNFHEFQRRYFVNLNQNAPKHVTWPNWQVRTDRREELQQKVAKHSFDAKKSDVLMLPALVKEVRFLELDPVASRHYATMARDFMAFLDQGVAVAEIVLTKLLRLQQICNGFVTTAEGTEVSLPCAKYEALEEILESISKSHKTVIWTNFRATYPRIANLLSDMKLPHVFLTGDQLADVRQRNIDAFNHDPSVRVIVANPQAGGAGISLTAASYMIYFSKGFSPEADRQSEARAYRGGSEIHTRITRIDLVTQGTVEEDIDNALRAKADVSEFLYELRKRFAGVVSGEREGRVGDR